MSQPFDLILVGATGFVGQIVCHYLVTHSTKEEFSWAIAGRSQTKLDTLKTSLGEEAQHLKTLQVDVTDEQQVQKLCQQTKAIVTTVGPYALYGETLVKVCAATGTDYCDLTGEVQWVQQMIAKYEAIAQQSGARIVHCCGFDSIPFDLGVFYLQQQAQEKFGEYCVRVKMRLKEARGGFSGGTAASGVNIVQEAIANPDLKQALKNPYILCDETAKDLEHSPIFSSVQIDYIFGEWMTPFVMSGINIPIVLRSNNLQNWVYGKNFQYEESMLVGTSISGFLMAYGLKFSLNIFGIMAAIAPDLLRNFIPAPGEGPSEASQLNGYYDLRFVGETASGQTIMVKVTGDRDPGYGSTAKILAQAGLSLLEDVKHSGGSWTPASIFGAVLITRLQKFAGLTFEIL